MAKARTYRVSQTVERPPAFQEYAAAELGNEDVRLMSPGERGLYWSMRAYCWMNDSIPMDPCMMARALGFTEGEVVENLTAKVLGFFEQADDDPQRLVCPALVRQMERLLARRIAQADGGRAGARARREKKFSAISNPPSTYVGLEYSREEKSTAEKAPLEVKTPRSSIGANSKPEKVVGPHSDFAAGYDREQAKETAGAPPARS